MQNEKHTAKQHFVPRFYLKEFANSDGQLHVFDTQNVRKLKPYSVGAVCYKPYFYGEKTGERDELSQTIEKHFDENIENPLSDEWPQLLQRIADSNQPISEDDKFVIAGFMVHMWLRNPSMREFINSNAERLHKQIAKVMYSGRAAEIAFSKYEKDTGVTLSQSQRDDIQSFVMDDDYSIEFSNRHHLKFMLDPENQRGFTNLICAQDWIIHITKGSLNFLTGERPLVIVSPPKKGFYGPSFLERTHLFPLTPNMLVEARPPKKGIRKRAKRKTYFGNNTAKIEELNSQLMSYSRFVYSKDEREIDWCVSLGKKIGQLENDFKKLSLMYGVEVSELKDMVAKIGTLPENEKDKAIADFFCSTSA